MSIVTNLYREPLKSQVLDSKQKSEASLSLIAKSSNQVQVPRQVSDQ